MLVTYGRGGGDGVITGLKEEDLSDVQKMLHKITYGANFAASVWRVKKKPEKDLNKHYTKDEIERFLQERVPKLVSKYTSPENFNSRSMRHCIM